MSPYEAVLRSFGYIDAVTPEELAESGPAWNGRFKGAWQCRGMGHAVESSAPTNTGRHSIFGRILLTTGFPMPRGGPSKAAPSSHLAWV